MAGGLRFHTVSENGNSSILWYTERSRVLTALYCLKLRRLNSVSVRLLISFGVLELKRVKRDPSLSSAISSFISNPSTRFNSAIGFRELKSTNGQSNKNTIRNMMPKPQKNFSINEYSDLLTFSPPSLYSKSHLYIASNLSHSQ